MLIITWTEPFPLASNFRVVGATEQIGPVGDTLQPILNVNPASAAPPENFRVTVSDCPAASAMGGVVIVAIGVVSTVTGPDVVVTTPLSVVVESWTVAVIDHVGVLAVAYACVAVSVADPELLAVPVTWVPLLLSPQLIVALSESPATVEQLMVTVMLTPVCPDVGPLRVQLGGAATVMTIGNVVFGNVAASAGCRVVSDAVAVRENLAVLVLG